MIFVTVGTHEQQFNRLIKEVDQLKAVGSIEDEVVMQIGYSTYEPKYCVWSKLVSYQKMTEYIRDARIIITHGGPASFIMPLQNGKVPIVVPRQKKYHEHVNNHQVEFCRAVAQEKKNIILVEAIEELKSVIANYYNICKKNNQLTENNKEVFCLKLEQLVHQLFEG